MSARRDSDVLPLPPLLARVIEAARSDPGKLAERTGHAGLLEELSQWALLYVPANGALAPDDEPAYKVIEAAAVRNLEYEKALQVSKGGKTTGRMEHVYAGTDRLKKELVKRRFALQRKPDAYVFGPRRGGRSRTSSGCGGSCFDSPAWITAAATA
jgi:hypothetical protein